MICIFWLLVRPVFFPDVFTLLENAYVLKSFFLFYNPISGVICMFWLLIRPVVIADIFILLEND